MSDLLAAQPRYKAINLPTPLVHLKSLSVRLDGPEIFMKRDDLTGLGMGGNKTRKLEYLLGQALAQSCDTVITCGAVSSNHSRQTAALAASAGLECHVVLEGFDPGPTPGGNLLLVRLFGARVQFIQNSSVDQAMADLADKLTGLGRKPYIIPFGGSNGIGSLGFAGAMVELKDQADRAGIGIDAVITPTASGGTQAGMVVGAALAELEAEVIGIGIDKDHPDRLEYTRQMAAVANETGTALNLPGRFSEGDFQVNCDYFGRGYAVVGDLEQEAIRLAGQTEGILLDPVYTGRTMGGLIDLIRQGRFKPGQTVIMWHTGGLPAVFDNTETLNMWTGRKGK